MHQSQVLLTDSHGNVWRYTPDGLERIPQPYYYKLIHAAMSVASRIASLVDRVV